MAKQKKATAPKKEVKDSPESFTYHVSVELNEKKFDIDTNDLKEAVMSVKPELLKTSVIFKFTKDGGRTIERFVYCPRAKILFTNPLTLDAFIRSIYF